MVVPAARARRRARGAGRVLARQGRARRAPARAVGGDGPRARERGGGARAVRGRGRAGTRDETTRGDVSARHGRGEDAVALPGGAAATAERGRAAIDRAEAGVSESERRTGAGGKSARVADGRPLGRRGRRG